MPSSDRVTKRAVDALTCPAGRDRIFLWDRDLAGFGVAEFPSGKKTYVIQYRQQGRSRRSRIGDHGRLTPEEARSLAKQALGGVEAGEDPIERRRVARTLRTFGEIANDFMRGHIIAKRKRTTSDAYDLTLRVHILPAIGSIRVDDIRAADIARLHLKLIDRPATANKALAIISSAWRWAAKRGERLGPNPVPAIDKFAEKRRERFLTTEELSQLGDALREGETVGLEWHPDETKPTARHAPKEGNRRVMLHSNAVAAIRLLALTGARLREILHLRWDHVDTERGVLLLPDSKTGRKTIYLSAAALNVIAALPRIAGNPYVIAGAVPGQPRHDLKKPWAAVTHAAGLEGLRLHDLRHSYASVGAGAQMGLPIIGKLLGHKQSSTTARYAHLATDPLHRAANTIGATIAAALDGQRSPDAPVIPIRSSNEGRVR